VITLIHPSIDPVIFSFGQLSIRWYGLSYVVGLLLGIIYIKWINKKLVDPIPYKIIDDFFVWGALGVIIGGRVGYVLIYQFTSFINEPLIIFYIWMGGMSFHGGLIGISIACIIYCIIKKINFLILGDMISTSAPIGLFFGRIANFINSELYGRVTYFNFAMIFPNIDNERRHPSQLYEAFFEGIIIFIIMFLITKKYLRKNVIGISTSIFLILYGFFRFFLEYLREPDPHIGFLFNHFTMGQILSIPMILLGFYILKITK